MKRLRVLQLIASSRGGGGTNLRDVALNLDQQRFEMSVAMPEDGGNIQRHEFEEAGIPFHRVDIASGFSVSQLAHIRRLVAQADILHVHGARAALYGRLAAATLRRRRPATAYSIQGFSAPHYSEPRRTLLLTIERMLAPQTDLFLGSCHAERRALVAANIAPQARTDVVWNVVDAARFQNVASDKASLRTQLGVPLDSLLVTMACRLYKPRDFDTLFRAVRMVIPTVPSVHVMIAGDGPMEDELRRLLASLGLGNHVTLLGWRSDLPAIYAASDLYVLTTWGWEGLPLTILEAMAAGLPVVATDAGGVPEAVAEGETGYLVGRRDHSALAAALLRLAQDPSLRARMAVQARHEVERQFSITPMVQKMTQIYERLAPDL